MNSAAGVRIIFACALAIGLSSCAPSGGVMREGGGLADPVMGDWQGHRVENTGRVVPIAAQAIALGNKNYRFVVQRSFDRREPMPVMAFEGKLEGTRLVIPEKPDWSVTLDNGILSGKTPEPVHFELRHLVRLSPTLGARPPKGAVVVFDGTNLDGWERRDVKQREMPVGWTVADGVMQVVPGAGDIMTTRRFTDFQLHLEFRTPFMPGAGGQARGNSGVYLQGRYEIQVLDSYGLKGEDNECGGIYKVSAPLVNMCAPPGQWQSYDITFHAPRFGADGKKVADARVSVVHNGVLIHEDLAIPGSTVGAIDENPGLPGGLLLQDHGNLVQYRNIWLYELKE